MMVSEHQPIHLSQLKTVARFARENWSHPGDRPFQGFEDSSPNEMVVLKNCRRQVFYSAQFFIPRGMSPQDVIKMYTPTEK